MQFRAHPFTRLAVALALASGVSSIVAPAAAEVPPGFNIHKIAESEPGRFWRGAAPRKDTLEHLAAEAKRRGVKLTLVDLRAPANSDDKSGKQNKLSPAREAALAKQLGVEYLQISAMSGDLVDKLRKATAEGDVYMHCMYGVNRTGFAAARFAHATGAKHPTQGVGKRDWNQGVAFEKARQRKAGASRKR